MDLYAQNILDHYKNPRNAGHLENPTVTHREANHFCGDILELDLKLNGIGIKDVRFRGEGCAISQASMSMLSEDLIGMKKQSAQKLSPNHIDKMLGIHVSSRRLKCALLSLLTLKNALSKASGGASLTWNDLI